MGGEAWFALHVKGRFEKCVSESLQHRGYEVFLPTYQLRRQWSDRIKQLELPLFPNYTFCRLEAAHRLPVLSTPGVMTIVGTGRTPEAIPADEIEAIMAIIQSGWPATPWPSLEPGQRVRVETGPLRGVSGIVLDFKRAPRLVVGVTLLQRSVAVELDDAWLVVEDRTGPSRFGNPIVSSNGSRTERRMSKAS